VETILLVEALGGILFSLVNIKYLPSLVGSIVSIVNLNNLTFNILTLINIKAPVGFLNITEVFSSVSKDLPPS
jgi:hypothetical protein